MFVCINSYILPIACICFLPQVWSFGSTTSKRHFTSTSPPNKVTIPPHKSFIRQNQPLPLLLLYAGKDDSVENIRDEIEALKSEALQKLTALDEKMSEMNGQRLDSSLEGEGSSVSTTATAISTTTTTTTSLMEEETNKEESESEYMERRLVERIAISNNPDYSDINPVRKNKRDETLLDGTSWKISLDIGREMGTWMPKEWGISGERLKIDFEIEFSDEQLYEREEFLGSMGDAKIAVVKGGKMKLSPSLTEGVREISVKNGGWRVSKGNGPMGTNLFRFYIETDEKISRKGGDVYCPAGRIYCSCGFFNRNTPSSGQKERYKKKLDDLIARAEALDDEIASAGFLGKLQKNAEMIRLKVEMQESAQRYREASIVEPDSSILKFSSNGEVGLTKEGGVCCKVNKGVAIEYHILGRFYIQSSKM